MLNPISIALLGLLSLATPSNFVTPISSGASSDLATVLGGPPAIRIANKAAGAISHAEWGNVEQVQLMGCAAGAQIVEVSICIKDCKGKNAALTAKGDRLTSEMLSMVANLPPGTPFMLTAKVIDGNKKELTVPAANYVWKG